jgi:hypothetical protein
MSIKQHNGKKPQFKHLLEITRWQRVGEGAGARQVQDLVGNSLFANDLLEKPSLHFAVLIFRRIVCAAPARVIIKLVLRERAFRTEVSCVRRSRRADNECPPGKRKP